MSEHIDPINRPVRGLIHALLPAALCWVVVGALLWLMVATLPAAVLAAIAVGLLVVGASIAADIARSRRR